MTSPYKCNTCQDTGWLSMDVSINDPAFGKLYRCGCQVEKDKEKWRRDCGLTASQLATNGITFKAAGPGTKGMVEAGRAFLKNPTGTLFIYGNNGVGKTSLAYSMVNRLINSGIQAVYITGPNMMAYIRDGYSAKTQDEQAMRRLDKMQSVKVLILDEIDKIKPTEWVNEILSMFIDNRYRRRDELGTVVIANSSDNLRPDVVSRLMEGAVILNNDPDYRMGGIVER